MNRHKIKLKIINLSPEALADALHCNGFSQCRQMLLDKQISGRELLSMTEFELKQSRHYLTQPDIRRLWSFLARIKEYPEEFVLPVATPSTKPVSDSKNVPVVVSEELLDDPNEWDDPPMDTAVNTKDIEMALPEKKKEFEMPLSVKDTQIRTKPTLPNPPPNYENVVLSNNPAQPSALTKKSSFNQARDFLETSLSISKQKTPVSPITQEPVGQLRKSPIPIPLPPKQLPQIIPSPPDEDTYEPSPALPIEDISDHIKDIITKPTNFEEQKQRPLPPRPVPKEDKPRKFEKPPHKLEIPKEFGNHLQPLPSPVSDEDAGYVVPVVSRPLPPVPEARKDYELMLRTHPNFRDVNRVQGEKILAKTPVGSFIFRTSGNYYCTIMIRLPERICNIPVLLEDDMLFLHSDSEIEAFQNLEELVRYYMNEDIPLEGISLQLRSTILS